ncbi:carboxypeptidase-like regulatory domain-containing protein [Aureisphaera galaxeae]|uniref:carboxypeptidase-like regulatory domain-containing protein n=1 Tax=Aureisphaera galaxeae TaxID=1538023 RepID=UPI002350FC28|nr:carboxypeptidase-like regulatory domain-containing protein [Aureisphaera galaxeae]MDC8003936.1 carboxypeptidase-like regulatory domain-containing protein [Aureisphaera galaxeae]
MNTRLTTTKETLRYFGFLALFMSLCLMGNPSFAQSDGQTVTGVVKSNDGPLLGATIVLKGTNVGVVSNENGEFTFPQELKQNDVLVVSYLGYKKKEITITNATTYVEPFLEDDPVIVVAALRMEHPETTSSETRN